MVFVVAGFLAFYTLYYSMKDKSGGSKKEGP